VLAGKRRPVKDRSHRWLVQGTLIEEVVMVKSVQIIPIEWTPGSSIVSVQLVFRGVDNTGEPFIEVVDDVDYEDIKTTCESTLVTNSVTWGIKDDVS
jgi:hypothetical protein